MQGMRRRWLPLACWLSVLPAWGMGGPDGVDLHCSRGPGADDVTLQWTGGTAPFGVFRSPFPVNVVGPGNHLGETSGGGWVDTPPPGGILFYLVQGQCAFGPPEVCDGIDNDCDPTTPDGDDDPQVGQVCDGNDSDLCVEGMLSCAGGSLQCSDLSGSTLDLCNGTNDDCDPGSSDGSEDPQVGASCDGGDGDLCLEGTLSCSGGSLLCSDGSGTTVEACAGDGVDEDCDGSVDEGFNRNDNPSCSAAVVNLGSISGDTGAGQVFRSRFDEEWYRIRIVEDSNLSLYVSATVQLHSPPGADFDLYVYCGTCGGSLAGSSIIGGLTGHFDTVNVRRDDGPFSDDSFDITIEVRHFQSSFCANWGLTVFGNTAVNAATCN